ncbi:Alpha-galactosidase [Sedimentisphaera cyanobacteriorum]|uniref:Alpha-galactosidase n=1 Tax=Sedimentisphaera cyanobacteriorum TaxID=1940790 RepID=A0A1Q2HL59_9BACT|nr:alpha-galactosidase [Sedimentisphaera cyanobacteriorum]AQQ08319.1 Alpha-galactosidase [Sedimentisphaera cyanobacteriorum]
MKAVIIITVGLFLSQAPCIYADLPKLNASFKTSTAETKGQNLIISTGKIERTFLWTGNGFVTEGLKNQETSKEWQNIKPSFNMDWSCPDLISDDSKAKLLKLDARKSSDKGFTSPHLEVIAEVFYPKQNLTLKQKIWAYPNASGLRQQIWAKGSARKSSQKAENAYIKAENAKIYQNNQSKGVRPDWETAVLLNNNALKFTIGNISKKDEYIVGLSWWDYGSGGRKQSAKVCSVDGETSIEVIKPTVLPGWKEGGKPAETKLFKLPQIANMDGTVTIDVEKHGPSNVNISEIWLFKKGKAKAPIRINPKRKRQLESSKPKGYSLAAYLSGSQAIKKSSLKERISKNKRVDYLPIDTAEMQVSAAGYYSDTQNRNKPETPVLREEKLKPSGECDWSNLLFIQDGNDGLVLVKESHKTVQTPGADTGKFTFGNNGITNTGWCLSRSELSEEKYKWLWGSWVIVHKVGKDSRERAVKAFDRLRFPTDKQRDMWTVMCTWGHSQNPWDGRKYAREDQVLRELEECSDIGIDMLLIDDGWQSPEKKFIDETRGWKPWQEWYPNGWGKVTEKAEKFNMRLGLWASHIISSEEMLWNYNRLGNEQFKIDFANLRSHTKLNEMKMKARTYMLENNHKSIVSWDTTEAAPRYGFYLFREYGNVHFMNRKPEVPGNVLYIPHLCLRDFWQLSRYQNLNKWQLVIQNPEVVKKQSDGYKSDAYKHSADYCAATALMGTPEFMAVARYYSEDARKNLRSLLEVYKEHRSRIWDSFVYPIGSKPNNKSWTGFQAVCGKSEGYLTIFREIENSKSKHKMQLRSITGNSKLQFTNLITGRKWNSTLDSNSAANFIISEPGDYLFLKYEKK